MNCSSVHITACIGLGDEMRMNLNFITSTGTKIYSFSRLIGTVDRFNVIEYMSLMGLPSWFGVEDSCAEYDLFQCDSWEEVMAYINDGGRVNPVDGYLFAL